MRIGIVAGVLLAFIEQPEVIEKILTHLGLWPSTSPQPACRGVPVAILSATGRAARSGSPFRAREITPSAPEVAVFCPALPPGVRLSLDSRPRSAGYSPPI